MWSYAGAVNHASCQPGPHAYQVGDFFLIADTLAEDPAIFEGAESPYSWAASDGTVHQYEMIEVPCEGGSDFGCQRVA